MPRDRASTPGRASALRAATLPVLEVLFCTPSAMQSTLGELDITPGRYVFSRGLNVHH